MTIRQWFHHLFDPHCEQCISERICASCEYLKIELEKAHVLNKELIEKLTTTKVEQVPVPVIPVDIKPRNVPWNVRRQMMEAEDRKAASVLRQRQQEMKVNIAPSGGVQIAPPDDPDVVALEKEMDLVAKEREANSAS